jgi:hypothetical protein
MMPTRGAQRWWKKQVQVAPNVAQNAKPKKFKVRRRRTPGVTEIEKLELVQPVQPAAPVECIMPANPIPTTQQHEGGVKKSRKHKLVRANSTSSLYTVGGTIAVPEEDAILRSVAMIICAMIEQSASPDYNDIDSPGTFFACSSNTPAVAPSCVYRFLKEAYSVAEWSQESNVIALVLVSRLQHANCLVSWRNWNMLLLVALLVAQKTWDDVPLTNMDFPKLWLMSSPDSTPFSIKHLTCMESEFLRLIDWNTHVAQSTYAQFYFELRALSQEWKDNAGFSTSKLQTDNQMNKLEVKSQRTNPSTEMQAVYERKREKCLEQFQTGRMPLRQLANRQIKVLS